MPKVNKKQRVPRRGVTGGAAASSSSSSFRFRASGPSATTSSPAAAGAAPMAQPPQPAKEKQLFDKSTGTGRKKSSRGIASLEKEGKREAVASTRAPAVSEQQQPKTTAPTTDGSANATTNTGSANLSRGQRKRMAKREQYLRREKMVMNSLAVKRQEEQKRRIDGLDAIRDALMDAAAKATGSGGVSATVGEQERGGSGSSGKQGQGNSQLKSNKSRRKLVQREVQQMDLVLQHPSFVDDPLATIREHLQNTIGSSSSCAAKASVHKKDSGAKTKKKTGGKRHRCRPTRSRSGR